MRAAVLALVLLTACAGASVETPRGVAYSAWAIGGGRAAAGKCDRVASDKTTRTNDRDTRETHDDERGTECATASGGSGSPGLYATLAGAFAALFVMLGGVL